jgi:hypothetical protein
VKEARPRQASPQQAQLEYDSGSAGADTVDNGDSNDEGASGVDNVSLREQGRSLTGGQR